MKRLINSALSALFVLSPMLSMAHPGHGVFDPTTPQHYLTGIHGIYAVVLAIVLFIAVRLASRYAERMNN